MKLVTVFTLGDWLWFIVIAGGMIIYITYNICKAINILTNKVKSFFKIKKKDQVDV